MSKSTVIKDFPASGHDHTLCIEDAIAKAQEICTERGERFTELRRTVLEILWRSHRPMKAYEVLEALSATGRRPAPPTAYRALDFLIDVGLVHKIESINAYVGCSDPESGHSGHFLICVECGDVAELANKAIDKRISEGAKQIGFEVLDQKIEIEGRCQACR
ncbi:MAG: Fur family transcriptional regulator [Pseudomonadota bacterium]